MRLIVRLLAALAILLAVAALAFVLWATWIPAPMPEAMAALESDAAVRVAGRNPIAFTPAASTPTCGFIFYQGGRVDERAYAPALRAVAAAGYLALTPSMPLNLAVFAPGRAASLIDAYPAVETWVIGGHSLGGAMAANFAYRTPGAATGLALWASFPADSNALVDAPLEVTSIYGTVDGVAPRAVIEESARLLPPETRFVPIEGGNHAQFGWYGDQRGDNPATITRAEQQAQTVDATVALLDALCSP